jgi:hypothetical protein
MNDELLCLGLLSENFEVDILVYYN